MNRSAHEYRKDAEFLKICAIYHRLNRGGSTTLAARNNERPTMRIQCKPSTVRSLPFFSALTEEELAEVLKAVQHRTYPARATIVRAGDPADGLYFILSGRVHVSLSNGHGREVIVAILGPNHFFGETGLLEGGARSEDVHSHDA
ncbi:MAG: cyclic nucleotide-binding domain-containing protein, partial [Burkholderiales bacterium]